MFVYLQCLVAVTIIGFREPAQEARHALPAVKDVNPTNGAATLVVQEPREDKVPAVVRDTYRKAIGLAPKRPVTYSEWRSSFVGARRIADRFIWNELVKLSSSDQRAAMQFWATRLGKGTPDQDVIWLRGSMDLLTNRNLYPESSPMRGWQFEACEAQVRYYVKNEKARQQFAQSMAWLNIAFTPRSRSPRWGLAAGHPANGKRRALLDPGSFPRTSAGEPTGDYWWDAREALLVATLCDSDADFSHWDPDKIDEHFFAWAKKWEGLVELGLLRPGSRFGWRIDRSKGARRLSVTPHPTIPRQPFPGCTFRKISYGSL